MLSVEGQHKDDHCVLNSAVCDVINLDLQRDNLNDSVLRETTLIVVHFLCHLEISGGKKEPQAKEMRKCRIQKAL